MKVWLVLPVMLFAALAAGCGGGNRLVMVVTSNPSEALIYVNDYPRGVTPIEIPYLYMGTYRIQLRHEGYDDLDELVSIGRPWYNWIPFMSLVIDSLPFSVRHERRLHFDLTPTPPPEF
ncbi:MAG: PEGA domain-containing protein [Candidatus Sumerlaeia bacterium]|nr:PEGA domain-containing protein [Candidatus Sumerlaeia bacterium]